MNLLQKNKERESGLVYLSFRLGQENFAMRIGLVREILENTQITPVPTSVPHLCGVVNVRGSATAVVDLRLRLGVPAAPLTADSRIIVMAVNIDGELCHVGGLADAVTEVLEFDPEEIHEAPSLCMRWCTEILEGVAQRKGRYHILVDMPKALAYPEDQLLQSSEWQPEPEELELPNPFKPF